MRADALALCQLSNAGRLLVDSVEATDQPLSPGVEVLHQLKQLLAHRVRRLDAIGRGKHVVEADLIAALDSGHLAYAALDALHPEPLPPDNPLWSHPKVTVMPHVARRPTVRQLVAEIAANIQSVEAGGGLLQEIDRGCRGIAQFDLPGSTK